MQLACPLKRGDGIVFDEGEPEELEQGGCEITLAALHIAHCNDIEWHRMGDGSTDWW